MEEAKARFMKMWKNADKKNQESFLIRVNLIV